MTTTVFGAVTRKKVRVALATEPRASSSVAFLRSTVTGVSRNAESKIRLMLARRAIEPEPRVRVVGMLADGFGVLDDGAVVILPALGVAAVAQRGRRDARGCGEAGQQTGGAAHVMGGREQ